MAKRARKAETPKQTSHPLRLRAPYLYPDQVAREKCRQSKVRGLRFTEFSDQPPKRGVWLRAHGVRRTSDRCCHLPPPTRATNHEADGRPATCLYRRELRRRHCQQGSQRQCHQLDSGSRASLRLYRQRDDWHANSRRACTMSHGLKSPPERGSRSTPISVRVPRRPHDARGRVLCSPKPSPVPTAVSSCA
jgi:hypothetical protein